MSVRKLSWSRREDGPSSAKTVTRTDTLDYRIPFGFAHQRDWKNVDVGSRAKRLARMHGGVSQKTKAPHVGFNMWGLFR